MFEAFINSWQASLGAAAVLMIPAVYFLRPGFAGRTWRRNAAGKTGLGWMACVWSILMIGCWPFYLGKALRFVWAGLHGSGWQGGWKWNGGQNWNAVYMTILIPILARLITLPYLADLTPQARRSVLIGMIFGMGALVLACNALILYGDGYSILAFSDVDNK